LSAVCNPLLFWHNAYKNLRVDRSTGQVSTEAGEPVWRYVDNRNWSVYGYDETSSNWNQMGEARMQGKNLEYKGDNDQWTNYDKRWKSDDERMSKEWKLKTDDMKIKTEKDGDVKIKTDDQKIKIDKDGEQKIKTDDQKIKVDKDGNVKQKDN
jgi:hypothetical protein